MEEEKEEKDYTFQDGEWCYSKRSTKKIVINCDKCEVNNNLTERRIG